MCNLLFGSRLLQPQTSTPLHPVLFLLVLLIIFPAGRVEKENVINNGFQAKKRLGGIKIAVDPVEIVSRFFSRLKTSFKSTSHNWKTQRMGLSLISRSELKTIEFKKRNDRNPFEKFKNCYRALNKLIDEYRFVLDLLTRISVDQNTRFILTVCFAAFIFWRTTILRNSKYRFSKYFLNKFEGIFTDVDRIQQYQQKKLRHSRKLEYR